jgi:hypothetical protein
MSDSGRVLRTRGRRYVLRELLALGGVVVAVAGVLGACAARPEPRQPAVASAPERCGCRSVAGPCAIHGSPGPLRGGQADLTHPEFERLMRAFFQSVSFSAGDQPRYAQIHELFIPEGKLIKNSQTSPEITGIEQFIESRQKLVDAGALTSFEEVECAETTEVFGNIAHRLSTYEKRGTLHGKAFEGRGVISTQFIRTPAGWRISSMAWDDERPGLTIPARYQPGSATS